MLSFRDRFGTLPRTAMLFSILALVSAGLFAEAGRDCPPVSRRVTLTLDLEAKTLVVDPETVEVYLHPAPERPGVVCWKVTNLAEGQTLHLDGKPGEVDLFPGAEREVTYPGDFALSGRAAKAGTWKYRLWVTVEGTEEPILTKDPEVIVHGSP